MKRRAPPISKQIKKRVSTPVKKKSEYDGTTEMMISTGSTLLDLAISGGRVRGGGIPGGIMVEIFGPPSTGKTVLLCEIAGDVQRKEGEIMFHDPEARLDKQFARIFALDTEDMEYMTPNTVTEAFIAIRDWIPKNDKINGVFTDSLAALSTKLELETDEGDKMGMRRAKEFSEQLRRTAIILTQTNTLLVCSNQIRENLDRAQFGPKYTSPGGKAISHYSSLRLRTNKYGALIRKRKYKGQDVKQVYGIQIEVEVFKSSIWHPSRTALVAIDFRYGIDDIRENLKFVKKFTNTTAYNLEGTKLSNTLDTAIKMIESQELQDELRKEVIDIWEDIEKEFKVERKPKKR